MLWFLIFAAAVFSLHFWREHLKRQKELNSPLASHRSGHAHIGQVVVLDKGLQNGSGRIRIGNREWPVRGPDASVFDQLKEKVERRALKPLMAGCRILRAEGNTRQGAIAGIIHHLTRALGPIID